MIETHHLCRLCILLLEDHILEAQVVRLAPNTLDCFCAQFSWHTIFRTFYARTFDSNQSIPGRTPRRFRTAIVSPLSLGERCHGGWCESIELWYFLFSRYGQSQYQAPTLEMRKDVRSWLSCICEKGRIGNDHPRTVWSMRIWAVFLDHKGQTWHVIYVVRHSFSPFWLFHSSKKYISTYCRQSVLFSPQFLPVAGSSTLSPHSQSQISTQLISLHPPRLDFSVTCCAFKAPRIILCAHSLPVTDSPGQLYASRKHHLQDYDLVLIYKYRKTKYTTKKHHATHNQSQGQR